MHTHDFACPVWIDGLHIVDVECRARFTVSWGKPAWFNPLEGVGEPAGDNVVEVVEVVMLGNKPDPAIKGQGEGATFLGKKSGSVDYVRDGKLIINPVPGHTFNTYSLSPITEFEAPIPSWLYPHVDAYLGRYEGDLLADAADADPDDGRADYEYDRRRDDAAERSANAAE